MLAKTSYSKNGIIHKIDVKLTKRDLAKVVAVVVLTEVVLRWPVNQRQIVMAQEKGQKLADKTAAFFDAKATEAKNN